MPLESINLLDKKEEFKPTADEMRVIGEKMKDPEFAKLMHEYVVSLEDPETRKEEEAYLEQMEREAKQGGDHSFDFIFPKGVFAVELCETKGRKVIINICQSDKVDEYREETTNDKGSANWHVPVSVSKPRAEDYKGAEWQVYDGVFNPKTLALAERSDKFVCFLVEIVVENINNGYKESFGFQFTRLSSSIKCVGTPPNQTVRKEKGKSAFPLNTVDPVSRRPQRADEIRAAEAASAKATSQPKPAAATAAPSKPSALAAKPAEVATVPKHSILHRGEIDLTDAWNWKISDKRIGIPKELIVKLELPEAAKAADLDIDVTEHYIDITKSTKHPYAGCITLPFSCDAQPIGAQFDKSKKILTLTLRVVPPTKPVENNVPEHLLVASATGGVAPVDPDEVERLEAVANQRKKAADDAVATQAAIALKELQQSQRIVDQSVAAPPPQQAAVQSPPKQQKPPASPPKEKPASAAPLAKETGPKPTDLSNDGDRMKQMMEKIAQARKEREEAEEADRLQEEADEKRKAEEAERKQSKPAPKSEDSVEVIDLRTKQQAWLDGVNEQQRIKGLEAERVAEEEAARVAEEARKQEKETRKRVEMERMQERVDAQMKAVMAQLPLKSKYIFDIDA